MQAELVSFRVLQHVSEGPSVAPGVDQPGAEAGQLLDLALGRDVEVEVHPVLEGLALGHPLEEEPGLSRHVPER